MNYDEQEVYLMVLVIILTVVLVASTNVHKVEAQLGAIYIKADGNIEGTTNIVSIDNVTYVFTADINNSIVVERSNIVVDGNEHTLNGSWHLMYGFNLTSISNVTIENVNIVKFGYAMWLKDSSQCVISNNNCTENEGGIWLVSSTGNTVSDNNVKESVEAVALDSSYSGNTIFNNYLTKSNYGVFSRNSTGNFISENTVTDNTRGIYLSASSENTVTGNTVTGNIAGIFAGGDLVNSTYVRSMNNIILKNSIANNTNGIDIVGVLFTTISRNHIAENSQYGITLDNANNNTISANNITNNNLGIYYDGLCNNNTAYHNNFIDNTKQVEISMGDIDAWDNGIEGNYWSNYTGVDLNYDGIGDSWFELIENNTDHYPLMGLFYSLNTSLGKSINVISNSSVSGFMYESPGTIRFHVSNKTANQTHGFCRVGIPYEVMMEPFNVTIDGANPTYVNYTLYDNGTHQWIYFEYEHSSLEIVIVPEFPSLIVLPLFMITTIFVAIMYKRKHSLS